MPALPLTFEQFSAMLAEQFNSQPNIFIANPRFILDLDFDSFELFRLALILEAMVAVELPDNVDLEQLRVRDVFSFYLAAIDSR